MRGVRLPWTQVKRKTDDQQMTEVVAAGSDQVGTEVGKVLENVEELRKL
jgi:hypothetical protein